MDLNLVLESEFEIQCVKGMYTLKLVSEEKNSGIKVGLHCYYTARAQHQHERNSEQDDSS